MPVGPYNWDGTAIGWSQHEDMPDYKALYDNWHNHTTGIYAMAEDDFMLRHLSFVAFLNDAISKIPAWKTTFDLQGTCFTETTTGLTATVLSTKKTAYDSKYSIVWNSINLAVGDKKLMMVGTSGFKPMFQSLPSQMPAANKIDFSEWTYIQGKHTLHWGYINAALNAKSDALAEFNAKKAIGDTCFEDWDTNCNTFEEKKADMEEWLEEAQNCLDQQVDEALSDECIDDDGNSDAKDAWEAAKTALELFVTQCNGALAQMTAIQTTADSWANGTHASCVKYTSPTSTIGVPNYGQAITVYNTAAAVWNTLDGQRATAEDAFKEADDNYNPPFDCDEEDE